MYLDSQINFIVAKHLNRVIGVAMNGDHTYWSDIEEDREVIVRSTPQNKHEVIVMMGKRAWWSNGNYHELYNNTIKIFFDDFFLQN